MSCSYLRIAVKNGEVDDEEEEELWKEKQEEMKEQEVQEMIVEMALEEGDVVEAWIRNEESRRCRMRVEERRRRVMKAIAKRIRAYLRTLWLSR